MAKKRIYIGKYIVLALLILAVAGGIFYWKYTRDHRDEVQIRKLIAELAQSLNKNSEESAAVAILKVKGIADSFVAPVDLQFGQYSTGTLDQEELLARAGRYRTMLADARVAVSDLVIVMQSPTQARLEFAGSFNGSTKNGMSHSVVKDIDGIAVKIDDRWKIKKLSFRDVLH